MTENPIADALGAPGSRNHFHQGDALQFVPQPPGGGESSEVDRAALEADRRNLHAPRSRPRWGTDEDGNPIEAPASGVPFDAETGGLATPDRWDELQRAEGAPRRGGGAARAERDPDDDSKPDPRSDPHPTPRKLPPGTSTASTEGARTSGPGSRGT
jgi:hypothetical protein